jgi:hypothetical protein
VEASVAAISEPEAGRPHLISLDQVRDAVAVSGGSDRDVRRRVLRQHVELPARIGSEIGVPLDDTASNRLWCESCSSIRHVQ